MAVGSLSLSLAALPARRLETPWEQALSARARFEATRDPTPAAYTALLDRFRAIYHDNPRDAHAAEAVDAVAGLLAEKGRTLADVKALHDAVGQYEFLRAQYPASPLRTPALLTEARLERDDLHDTAAARRLFGQVLRESPHSASAATARTELASLDRDAPRASGRSPGVIRPPAATADMEQTRSTAVNVAHRGVSPAPSPDELPGTSPETHAAPSAAVSGAPASHPSAQTQALAAAHAQALVTGIRHWSTPSYTRVAIDLGNEVTFEAARVPNPDRIYFDLHGARLTPELAGKSFEVTDDGFLKRIRAAQAAGDITRVVLDVNDVAEYSAFLLPNPYRLIIDIHGGKADTAQHAAAPDTLAAVPVAPAAARQASAAANVSGLPAMAPTDGGEIVRPAAIAPVNPAVPAPRTGVVAHVTAAKPVPNTVAVKSPASTVEVAAVSAAPGRVEATSAPTSAPIATPVPASARTAARKTRRGAIPEPAADPPAPARAAEKTADGETSLVRALGLTIGRIVIDAGHGGHDSGTLGVDGIEEKDVVLDVALRLGKLLHERLGAEILYTRSDDTFIPLETRTAIANKAQADLFLSIHANSSQDPTARGVETYYLNFTSDSSALDVAARENAVGGQSVHQLSDLVKKIALKDKIAESREFAADVEDSLFAGLVKGNDGLKNRGVKKAPFVVLIGANMPSILAEISFVTNPRDAGQLRQPEYRQRVAESLYRGVERYQAGLAGARSVAAASPQPKP